MDEKINAYKLELDMDVQGFSRPVWVYDRVPEEMRPAVEADLVFGMPVLHLVRIGPDAGKYYTSYVTRSTRSILRHMIRQGVPVYVKK